MRIIFSTPTWAISGVNSFTHNLIRGLQKNHSVELLLIKTFSDNSETLPLPTDIQVTALEWDKNASWWNARWEALKTHLEAQPDTIYVPNYDFENSSVIPALHPRVGALGIVHSDDPYHYEHVDRLGRYWDACVNVSSFLQNQVSINYPVLANRTFHIGYGVPHDDKIPTSPLRGNEILRILYTGRLYELQKRVSDLVKIAHRLEAKGVPFQLTIVGRGEEEETMRASLAELIAKGSVTFLGSMNNDEVLKLYEQYDCFVLTSNFEGLPVSLLEAMSAGVIPVVTAIRSGIPDVVVPGENGYILPIGDVDAFVESFAELQRDKAKRAAYSAAAFQKVAKGDYAIEHVVDRYNEVIDFIRQGIASGRYVRPECHRPGSRTGAFIPPAGLQMSPDEFYTLKWQYDRLLEEKTALQAEHEKLQGELALERSSRSPVALPASDPSLLGKFQRWYSGTRS